MLSVIETSCTILLQVEVCNTAAVAHACMADMLPLVPARPTLYIQFAHANSVQKMVTPVFFKHILHELRGALLVHDLAAPQSRAITFLRDIVAGICRMDGMRALRNTDLRCKTDLHQDICAAQYY